MSKLFIGTQCDRKFVDLTCVMLSSVYDNGCVPDATIVIAAFDLTPEDETRLRLSAGTMGRNMRFVPVPRDSHLVTKVPSFDFPFPMLGCLVLPKTITEPDARLLMLDSDMIVNSTLEPLFEMDLQGHPIAAVKDMLVEHELHVRGRKWDDNHFNTGLLLVDVDLWNRDALGDRAMIWLADQPSKPEWPDQDALNHVVGPDWLRLDRRWNFAYCGEPHQFSYDEYSQAKIVHFSGAKPTEARDHPAVPIYDRQAEKTAERTGWNRTENTRVDRDFVASAYEILLGRPHESNFVIQHRLAHAAMPIINGLLTSDEFRDAVVTALRDGTALPHGRWPGKPTLRQKYWAADRLPLAPTTRIKVEEADSWLDLLATILSDERFQMMTGCVQPKSAAA
ncbi:glycosyltransferase [uncultured Sphingomonas sp.]|uniref:glycosyltransferase family 8 protein n=1 Tax=uncultured Sphingomonas sp. TaxID=158754 RepID=UPI0025E8E709|nr:glycosyltransferase [uncultured Sphingomonas sp.]